MSEQEVRRILELYGDSLFRLALVYVKDPADAQDIVQETLIRYVHRAPDFSSGAAEKAWLMQVCANLSKNHLRFRSRHQTSDLCAMAGKGSENADLSYVWQAVASLPEKYREVVHLYYQEGYTATEIGQMLSKKEATVRSLLSRARTKLKDILREEYDFD